MAWPIPDPSYPTSGTVITRAFAVANLIDPINWLRRLTGNADPPGVGYVARATSMTLTDWYDLDTALAARVARANPNASTSMAGAGGGLSGFYDVSPVAGDAPAVSDWLVTQNRHTNLGVDYRFQLAAQLYNQDEMYVRMVINGVAGTWRKLFHAGNFVPGAYVPSGLIASFRTAGAIASGWTRFTDGDGRILIGAGTTFSQTFTENTAPGSNWTPFAGHSGFTGTASDQVNVTISGAQPVSSANHQNSLSIPAQTWTPVARVVVHAIKS